MLEKFFNFIIKETMKLYQLVGIDSAEIVVPFTNIEILSLKTKKLTLIKNFLYFF